jgi:ATP-dependent DNA helicase DinG
MVKAFTDHLRAAADVVILSQNELPKRRLIEQFESDETSVLVATMGFWEGIDVPGRSLQLVVLDKVPFPRPNDPLWQARREGAEAAGLNAFQAVDLPRAAVLLAQGAGRLIRTVDDRGVVALLDSRMATKSYGRVLVDSLPPMPGTTDLDEITDFLGRL